MLNLNGLLKMKIFSGASKNQVFTIIVLNIIIATSNNIAVAIVLCLFHWKHNDE